VKTADADRHRRWRQIDTLIAHGMPPNEVVIFAAREWGWTLRGAAQVVAKRTRTRR
jgi:hypothetical protein